MTTIAEGIIEVRADTSRVGADLRSGVARQSSGLTRAGSGLGKKFGLALGGAAATTAFAGGALVKNAVQLEAVYGKTMNVLQATTRASGREMNALDVLAKKMGADTVFSANDASQAMLELARGGLTTAEIRAGALNGTMTLAAAGELSMSEAANVAVKSMGQFNLEGKEMDRVAAALAGGANASSASVGDMASALAQGGLAANSVGFSIQETTGILAAFSNAGLEGSDAGTSLKTTLDRLQPSSAATKEAMKALGIVTEDGTNRFIKANGEFKSAAEIAEVLKTATEGLDSAERKRLITQAFGSDAQRGATILAEEGADGLQKLIDKTSDTNAAQRMAKSNMKGTAGALEQLKGSAETAMLTLGQGLAPTVRRLANYINEEGLPAVQRFADWFREDGADQLADFAGNAADAAGSVKDLVGWLNSLPEPAKLAGLTSLLGGGAALKLRGASSVVGTALKLTRPMPVFVTNPGFGSSLPGGGGPAGGAAATGKGLLKLGGATLLIGAGSEVLFGDSFGMREQGQLDKQMNDPEGFGRLGAPRVLNGPDYTSTFDGIIAAIDGSVDDAATALSKLPQTILTRFDLLGVPESKAEAKKLADVYDLTPKEKRTMFRVLGFSEAKSQTEKLIEQYNLTPGQKTTNFDVKGVDYARQQLAHFTQDLARIRDKTVTVTTVFTESGRRFKEDGSAGGPSPRPIGAPPSGRSTSGRAVELTITNWEEGTGYFREVANGEVTGEADFGVTLDRMGARG